MSNEVSVSEKLEGFLIKAEDKFVSLNASVNPLNFASEVDFARQALVKNDWLMQVARGNPESLKDAVTNVAAIGISLNPANKHAYLVPRKVNNQQSVCLDISYMGLIKLATDTGVVDYMKAEIVYSNDDFTYEGFDRRPVIKTKNPFNHADRGGVIGCVAWAKLNNGDYLNELMSVDELHQIRDDSEAYKGAIKKGGWTFDNCVWVKYYGEMIKKTVIKRLSKTLPQSDGSNQISKAIDVLNEHEGIEFNNQPQLKEYTDEQSDAYRFAIDNNDFVGLLCVRDSMDYEGQNQLWKMHEEPRIEKGGKGKYGKAMQANTAAARELRDGTLQSITEYLDGGDESAVLEIIRDCNQWELQWYVDNLNNEQSLQLAQINQVKAA